MAVSYDLLCPNLCVVLFLHPLTLFVPVEQNALGLQDEDDVFWVGTIQDFRRLGAKELVGFIDFLKNVLKQ